MCEQNLPCHCEGQLLSRNQNGLTLYSVLWQLTETEQPVSSAASFFLLIPHDAFGYRHSYVNTVQCSCIWVWICPVYPGVCAISLWSCSYTLYSSSSRVSCVFEHHVGMIIKAALFRLQTYGMNMDKIWHQSLHQHPACAPLHCWCTVKVDRPRIKQSLWEFNLSLMGLSLS